MQDSIQAARNGSGDALGRLLEGCRQYLLLIANEELHAHLHAKVAPSDLVQETFLEAHRDFDGFQGVTEDDFMVWLRQILLNNIRDAVRRYRELAKRRISRESSLSLASGSSAPRHTEPADNETPSWLAQLSERENVLRQALAELSPDHKQVIVLRNLELKSFVEIGRMMNRSADAVRKLWFRALQALEQKLGDDHAC